MALTTFDEPRPICGYCDEPIQGFATIGDIHYCHHGSSPTCYELAQMTHNHIDEMFKEWYGKDD